MWTVQPGDTLFNIARATGTTVERIVALNPNLQPENLEPGMQICLPEETALPRGPIPPCASGLYWVVAQGDSLFSIARTYGTTVERLLELNPGIDPLNLQIGMSICLPG
ncbi:MAG TPA: LysM peptidoglycan-binding domain-containing protein [Firmicutes bacterium]|jgi:LysM repeat protein|nr:LysM peptidoglycan-binding domain-containing protein [Candidatus Fermentithermobacillaceae bacterium]